MARHGSGEAVNPIFSPELHDASRANHTAVGLELLRHRMNVGVPLAPAPTDVCLEGGGLQCKSARYKYSVQNTEYYVRSYKYDSSEFFYFAYAILVSSTVFDSFFISS
jgi:hypothetical protein